MDGLMLFMLGALFVALIFLCSPWIIDRTLDDDDKRGCHENCYQGRMCTCRRKQP